MNKMNKKGFTLIEMLVVIAIIAVLVSIIIPTVSSATNKAGAAANAANLRSVYAELQTDMLSAGENTEGYVVVTYDTTTKKFVPSLSTTNAPPASAKTVGIEKGVPMTIGANGEPTYDAAGATAAKFTINYFATVAETGKAPS